VDPGESPGFGGAAADFSRGARAAPAA